MLWWNERGAREQAALFGNSQLRDFKSGHGAAAIALEKLSESCGVPYLYREESGHHGVAPRKKGGQEYPLMPPSRHNTDKSSIGPARPGLGQHACKQPPAPRLCPPSLKWKAARAVGTKGPRPRPLEFLPMLRALPLFTRPGRSRAWLVGSLYAETAYLRSAAAAGACRPVRQGPLPSVHHEAARLKLAWWRR